VLALGGAGLVEETVLRQEGERRLRVTAAPGRALGFRDLLQGAAEVNCAGARTLGRPPRNRPVERVIDLEGGGPVAKVPEAAHVVAGQAAGRDADELARAHIAEHRPGRRQLIQGVDRRAGLELASELPQERDERVSDPPGASAREWPAEEVAAEEQDEPEPRGRAPLQGHHGVSSAAGQKGAGPVAAKAARGEARGRPGRVPREARQGERMRGQRGDRAEHRFLQLRPVRRERLDEPPVRVAVGLQPRRGRLDRPLQQRPCSASGSSRKTGEPGTKGWMDEQTSWRKPGSVSSAERVPPPKVSSASRTRTRLPARARVTAATRPFGPDPTTTAS
jgi:hypothetical protein